MRKESDNIVPLVIGAGLPLGFIKLKTYALQYLDSLASKLKPLELGFAFNVDDQKIVEFVVGPRLPAPKPKRLQMGMKVWFKIAWRKGFYKDHCIYLFTQQNGRHVLGYVNTKTGEIEGITKRSRVSTVDPSKTTPSYKRKEQI